MKTFARAAAALLATAAVAATAAPPAAAPAAPAAQAAATAPSAKRQQVSSLIGYDIAQSIAPVAPDMDLAAFQRAVTNAFADGKPLLTNEEAQQVGGALMQRIGARNGQGAPGSAPGTAPEVSKEKVGFLVGADVGRSLAPIKDEIDVAVMIESVRATFAGRAPAMDEATRNRLREEFSTEMRAKDEARAAALARTNRDAGAKFLMENKSKKGVFTTPSGLQYMVLRQGSGARPKATDKVRVNYHGTLLDGTVFDSSYEGGRQPAEFMLNQVIQGWTEGVAMMPVGAKYRFWVPSQLGYGERGAGGKIGPNATLVFDVELLAIAP